MKFVRVTNKINKISTNNVEFLTNITGEIIHINRIFQNKVNWKLQKNGIYVRREMVEAYKLTIN